MNHSIKPVRLWRMLFLTFVIDTWDPPQEFEFTLRTSVMLMAEAESFFTDDSRLAVITQLSTALRKF